jgi:glycosyltransferase involved in cell wall biosynthesis
MEMESPEVSVVIPCLDEEAGIGVCVRKALKAFAKHGIDGEVVVADNGSSDNSIKVAEEAGARVVKEPRQGYGRAYLKAFGEAKGRYLIMGDADTTYDFGEVPVFVDKLREGYDYVSGNRFAGGIMPGAMPFSHRYIGNPMLTTIMNVFFKTGVGDAYCGMRGMTRSAYRKMDIRSTGWEFALEMAIKAGKTGLKKTDIPIKLYRREGESKLNTFRDGWRSLRFMLLLAPFYLFAVPGMILMTVGLILIAALASLPTSLLGPSFRGASIFVGSALLITGLDVILLGLYSKIYAMQTQYDVSSKWLHMLFRYVTLERGMLVGIALFLLGFIPSASILFHVTMAHKADFGEIQLAIIALTLIVMGVQIIFGSFFISILGIPRKPK